MNTEIKTYHGYWWLPSNSSNKVAGILSINSYQTIELKTIGILESNQSFINFLSHEVLPRNEIILGQTVEGNLITLINSQPEDIKRNSIAGVSTSIYKARIAIIGERQRHFKTIDDVNFTFVQVRFDLLDLWISRSGFGSKSPKIERDERNHIREFEFNLQYIRKIKLEFSFVSKVFFDSHAR